MTGKGILEMNREDELLKTLNNLIEVLDPIKFESFNSICTAKDQKGLERLEKKNPKVGIRYIDHSNPSSSVCMSVAAIIATITNTLVDKRLAFKIDENGYIVGFQWYEPPRG